MCSCNQGSFLFFFQISKKIHLKKKFPNFQPKSIGKFCMFFGRKNDNFFKEKKPTGTRNLNNVVVGVRVVLLVPGYALQ